MSDVTVTEKFVLFWGGWPSQWFKCRFVVGGVAYNCCEQFMMAEKARVFGDVEAEGAIMAAGNPREQKALGRKVRGFDEGTWNSVCRGIVYRANLAKFEQDAELNRLLMETGSRTVVEASPKDPIWGIGLGQEDARAQDPAQWRGTNWLGVAIMQARDELRRRLGESVQPVEDWLRVQLVRRDGIVVK